MLVIFFYVVSGLTYKRIYYGIEERFIITIERMLREYSQKFKGDEHFQKMCSDAIAEVSGYVYEFHPNISNNESLKGLASNFDLVEIEFYNTTNITIDLAHANQIPRLKSENDVLQIKSSIHDISKSLPFVYISSKVNFSNNIQFNTIVIECYTTAKCIPNVAGKFMANNLITPSTQILQNPQIHSTNKIYYAGKPGLITFNKDNIEVDDVSLSNDISIMISPYIFSPMKIGMFLPKGVTPPKSTKIYFDEPNIMYAEKICKGAFNIDYYYQNKFDRNSSLEFSFDGEWQNVQNFELILLVNDLNKPFINVSGIPKNIKYKLQDDELLHIETSDEEESTIITESEGETETTNFGMRSSLAPCTFIIFVIGAIFSIIV
ncbi:hypothetical protein GPJ56_001373 [Histomonas meleagridis]|uniref:uncharacterized protein n=1 Tax=Histomonas meleagridis TaxID=135588 RepID=UPI00355A9B07|nr:hypothetical protein GPJ56_001373 [Histomonas meleagridis]KAH0798133.1 hypothetical protein GO595_008979 [Histomonas meleagridis]